ncbi:MAG TPA: glycerol-3-phosphate 1-O-acyltransferase PlsY [Acidovorax defluvii]|jgi:glycerol-3-phosphate acyltransferase PlsY|uniref:glycerol-3-phosphate 1-O-acyltransferase PlsY n=1 Tax=unclassified Polaromonas TaxID=2638319 RepID=UPI000BCC6184|nr:MULTISPECIES: glycerol-3-phosphate 1-O-acyltransferase PlsY [unclassified Polaromonas]HQS22778.1 glycerol-3-phosphate 1-O-acyltransferase PlsY [Acidovorax defluvii]OYY37968.1 MAG: glycerol-3-phosphate acyltransferase [Polaromonas sp. 35-63-35]OYZ21149.1 MAG: glycerol-3-phosphate acyltransferase [Polaromonas sp. 16-63-31]OYZ79514.1 MAG: glycerol-3-phosphate acyltransferase [Polaromonas sp. 24-63-21]OZA50661.1 MAG: glycerol-3-phosphate acyltransferase [Polaromonas sp. 17-63-33]
MDYAYSALAVLAAYLIGSLSFAVIVSRLMGLNDPRSYGSKNPGATNVLRSGNKAAAALTLLLDGLKGWLPMALVMWFGKDYGMREGTLAAVGLAAFVGHLYPVFFGFQGGKGVATAAGVLFGVHWVLGLATLATWVIVAFFSRYSSLAAIACAIFAPWYYLIGDRSFWYVDKMIALAIVAMSAFLIFRHRENINKLLKGTESKLGAKKKG